MLLLRATFFLSSLLHNKKTFLILLTKLFPESSTSKEDDRILCLCSHISDAKTELSAESFQAITFQCRVAFALFPALSAASSAMTGQHSQKQWFNQCLDSGRIVPIVGHFPCLAVPCLVVAEDFSASYKMCCHDLFFLRQKYP